MSKREEILEGIVRALYSLAATVERDVDYPVNVKPQGLIIVRSAAPEILDTALGYPRSYYFSMEVPLELYVVGNSAGDRARKFDLLATQSYLALLGDTDLLSKLAYIEPLLLEPENTGGDEGEQTFTCAQMTVRVEYESEKSIG